MQLINFSHYHYIAAGVYAVLLSYTTQVVAQKDTLPEPLTLEYALSVAEQAHPDVALAQANVEQARAGQKLAESAGGVNSKITATARWVEPNAESTFDTHDDSSLTFSASKDLYDFGRTKANISAAEADTQSQQLSYTDVLNDRRIKIMRAYFDVLLADLEFFRDNEDMAVAYVQFDKAKDRRELGTASEIEILERESRFQEVRRKRYASEAKQRVTRSRLAMELNRPGQLPNTLAVPELAVLKRELPDIDELKKKFEENNLTLRALRKQIEKAQSNLEAARAGDNPVLRGEVEAGTYNRDFNSRDDYRVGLVLEVPLTTGGRTKAEVARRQAELQMMQAEYANAKMELEQRLLESWLSINTLKAQLDGAKANYDYRELYLDQSRALYEMEVRTDLGDSMVRMTDAQLFLAETEFSIAMAWANLDVLLGKSVSLDLAGDDNNQDGKKQAVKEENKQ